MPIYSGSNNIKEVYNGSQSIGYVYNGSDLVWQRNPYPVGTVIVNTQAAGSIELFPGTYELKTSGAGGNGANAVGYWVLTYSSGGSGACWEGTFKLTSKKTLSWTAGTGIGTSITVKIDNVDMLTAGGGGNASASATGATGGAGGTISVQSAFSSLIVSTSISSNGTKGEAQNTSSWSTVTSITNAPSTMGWGKGANSKKEGRTEGAVYLKRVA